MLPRDSGLAPRISCSLSCLRSSSRFFEQKRDRLESKLRTSEKQTHNIATMWKIKGRLRENVNISLTLYLWCIKFLSLCVRYSAKKRIFPLSPLNSMAGSASSRGSKRGKSRFSHASLMRVAKREASVSSSVFNFLAGSKTFRLNSACFRPAK